MPLFAVYPLKVLADERFTPEPFPKFHDWLIGLVILAYEAPSSTQYWPDVHAPPESAALAPLAQSEQEGVVVTFTEQVSTGDPEQERL